MTCSTPATHLKNILLMYGTLLSLFFFSSCCTESQREAALLLGQFASADSDCKVLNKYMEYLLFTSLQ